MKAPISSLSLSTNYARKLSGLITLLMSSPAWAVGYTFTDLDPLGTSASYAYGINDRGQVVGTVDGLHAMLWNGATQTDLGKGEASAINNAGQVVGRLNTGSTFVTNGATVTTLYQAYPDGSGALQPTAINNAGQISGFISTGQNHAIRLDGTTVTRLASFSDEARLANSVANDINDLGQVVGYSHISSGYERAALWNGTSNPIALDNPAVGISYSIATAINNAGQVVGYGGNAGNNVAPIQAILWNGTVPTVLGTLGGSGNFFRSMAYDINDAGQAVGFSMLSGKDEHRATLWDGTTATDLNSFLDASVVSAGWVLEEANAINSNGWIVGEAHNIYTGNIHAFLLSTPVPVPAAAWLLGSGLLGLIGVAKRKASLQGESA